jgi:PAS domain S-box-containing protein
MTNAIQEHEPSPYLRTAFSTCTILIGEDNSYVEVSDGFCRLVGYSREELLRMKLEDLAAPGTADITTAFNPSKATGCAHGLWLLVSREGTRILVRYESWVRSDLLLQSKLELIGAGY